MLLIPDLPEFDVGDVIFVLSTLVGAVALAIGALVYGVGTWLVSRKAVRIFERVDL